MALALCALLMSAACGADKKAGYGEIVRFAKGHDVVFPGFAMRYLGERQVSHPVFKPGFTYYDFEVRSPRSTQTVSWSSGTGVIDSASFKVDGRPFELELRGSILKKGWLREDEMVVWPQDQFLRALKARHGEGRAN